MAEEKKKPLGKELAKALAEPRPFKACWLLTIAVGRIFIGILKVIKDVFVK